MESGHDSNGLFSGIDRLTQDQFRAEALHWLLGRIGFDGVIWGSGRVEQGRRIDLIEHFLDGRPHGLIEDHPHFSTPAAFIPDFIFRPESLRNIRVADDYHRGQFSSLREHLELYRVRHILLRGIRQSRQHELAWIGFLREDARQPFDDAWSPAAGIAMSLVLHASEYMGLANARLPLRASFAMPGEDGAGVQAIHLTDRQKQVLHCLLQGWSNKLIARRLEISENTLKSHLQAIYQAMHVSSRSQAILHAGKFVIHGNVDCGDFRFEL